jgi:hypothetical protein
MFGAIDCLFKSRLALFHWTINRKPHLATKVRELWFLPRRESVEYQLEYPGAFATSTGIASGDHLTFILERRLACDLLVRLTELRSLAIAALNDKYEGRIIALENLPDHPIQLTDLPYFSKLTSIHITCGYLNWTIVTLPTVRTICVDNFARVDRPTGDSKAWNITSFILNMDSNISQFHKNFIVAGAAQLLIFLPNVRSLTLGSRLPDMDHHEKVAVFNRFGLFSLGNVRKLLVNGPSIEELKFTYGENALFYGCGMVQLDVRQFNQLRRIESAERGLLGTSYHASGPVDILPPHIRTLVITHPTSLKQENWSHNYNLMSWLGELTRTDFPHLERVEIVCSVGFGEKVDFVQCSKHAANTQKLKAIGVTLVVRTE